MSHFNVSIIVWTKSQDSVHKPQFSRREESRSDSNRGLSAYQLSASQISRRRTGTNQSERALHVNSAFPKMADTGEDSMNCRYLVVFLSSFSLLFVLYAVMNRITAHLFSLLKCIFTICIYLSQTLPFFRLVC